jgi:hypothetical protein
MPADVQELTIRARNNAIAFAKAARHIPADKHDWKPAPSARSAAEILAHTAYWNVVLTEPLRGKTLDVAEDDWIKSQADFQDPKRAEALARQTGEAFAAAVEGLRETDYEKQTSLPWGEESLYHVVLGNLWHLTYHSAQLNYIQTLLGDTEEH